MVAARVEDAADANKPAGTERRRRRRKGGGWRRGDSGSAGARSPCMGYPQAQFHMVRL
jgi:hypothetical protein